MISLLIKYFEDVVSAGTSVVLLVVLCAGLAAMAQNFWFGLAIMAGGSIITVAVFGMLAMILCSYEEVKAIRKLMDDKKSADWRQK